MDIRVLAAVFLTLFATAVGMAQTDVTSEDIMGQLGDLRGSGGLQGLLEKQVQRSSNTSIEASLDSSSELDLKVNSPARIELELGEGGTLDVGGSDLTGDSTVELHGFTGSVSVSEGNSSLDGSIMRFSTADLGFNYSTPEPVSLNGYQGALRIHRLEGQNFVLENSTGEVDAEGTTVELDGEKARFEYFNGNVSGGLSSYNLEGTVYRAELGGVTVGVQ